MLMLKSVKNQVNIQVSNQVFNQIEEVMPGISSQVEDKLILEK